MRILYVDVSLRQTLGHHFNASQSLVGALRTAGHDVTLAVSRGAQGFEGERCFRNDVYRAMAWNPDNPSERRKLSKAARRAAMEVWPLLERTAPDLIYAHSADAGVCAGLLTALDGVFDATGIPPLVAELPFPCEPKENYHYGAQLAALHQRLIAGSWRSGAGFAPVTVNAETSRLLAAATGLAIGTMPSPYVGRGKVSAATARPLRVGCLGHQNESKGYHLLPEIVASPLLADLRAEFVIQVQPGNMDDVAVRLRNHANRLHRLTLVEESLDGDAYYALANSIDIFLLPYEPRRYVSAISGIAYEALSQGSVIVAPRKTTVGAIVATYQPDAPLFDAWESGSISEALHRAISTHAVLAPQAAQGAETYCAENGPAAYVRVLEEIGMGRSSKPCGSRISRALRRARALVGRTFP